MLTMLTIGAYALAAPGELAAIVLLAVGLVAVCENIEPRE